MPAGGALATARHGKNRPLVLAGGRWNDSQIVSKAWIETSTAPKIEATGGQFYGYLCFLGGRCPMAVSPLGWRAWSGGQSESASSLSLISCRGDCGILPDYSLQAFQVQSGIFKDVLRGIPPPS